MSSGDSARSGSPCCWRRWCASRATLKGPFPVALAAVAFLAFYLAHVQFLIVLLGCGFAYLGWRKAAPAAAVLALLLPSRADAAESAARRVFDISWFFLKVGLFSFGGAYAALPYIREGAVATYGWISDREMIDDPWELVDGLRRVIEVFR